MMRVLIMVALCSLALGAGGRAAHGQAGVPGAAAPAGAPTTIAPPLAPDVIVVRGGEHPGFTRLTLQADRALEWTLRPDGADTIVVLDGVTGTLDTTRAFDRIGRDRLADITPVAGGGSLALRLVLAGDHSILAFQNTPGLLVVDIRDRSQSPLGASISLPDTAGIDGAGGPPPPPTDATPAPPPDVPGDTVLATAGAAAAWLRHRSGTVPGGSGAAPALERAAEDGAATSAPPPPDAAFGPALSHARDRLTDQVARAASQGAIHIAPHPLAPAAAQVPPLPLALTPQAPGPTENRYSASAVGISIDTVPDRDHHRHAGQRIGTSQDCVGASALDPAGWHQPTMDWDGIAAARAAVLGDFDKPLPGAVEGLVHAYLSAGLGVEATAVLAAFGGEVAFEDRLTTLARVIEGATEPGSAVARMHGCPGAASVWAVLASGTVPARDALDRDAMDRAALVLAFASMPRSLRRMIGPRLAGMFLDAGERALASTLQEVAQRGLHREDPPSMLFDALVALDSGDTAAAMSMLRPLASALLPEGPEAAILLVEAHLASELPVPTALRELLQVLLTETRASALGSRLGAALALAAASVGQFDAAFDHRRAAAAGLSEASAAMLDHRLLGLLVASADDAGFLQQSLGVTSWRGGAAPPDLRHDLGRRFLGLGLPELALDALASDLRAPAAERLLRAQAQLQLGHTAEVLQGLGASVDGAAVRLRASALEAMGDRTTAVAALVSVGDADAAASVAWRSGDRDLIAAHGTALQRAALPDTASNADPATGAAAVTALPGRGPPDADPAFRDAVPPDAPPDLSPGPLTRARQLLATADAVRDDLYALLDLYPRPVDAR